MRNLYLGMPPFSPDRDVGFGDRLLDSYLQLTLLFY